MSDDLRDRILEVLKARHREEYALGPRSSLHPSDEESLRTTAAMIVQAIDGPDTDFSIADHAERVHYEVESRHHVFGTVCLCGFETHVKRDMTRHIVTATLVAAGLEEE